MKYLLLIYMDENALSDTEREHCYVESADEAIAISAERNSEGTPIQISGAKVGTV